MKRLCGILSLLILLTICVVLLPTEAQAASSYDLTFTLQYPNRDCYAVSDCNTSASGTLTIPSTYNGLPVVRICSQAFTGCNNITSIKVPDSVTTIDNSAFYGCEGLKSITLSNNLTMIYSSTFKNCTSLTNITIPEGVTSIGSSAFSGCTGLTSIGLPKTITNIDDFAFSGCAGLTEITIPEDVTSIGGGVFSGCTNLTTINYNAVDCVEIDREGYYIDSMETAFTTCENLTTVNIGAKVKRIPSDIFINCKKLENVVIYDSIKSIGSNAFYGCTNLQYHTYENAEYFGNMENHYVVLVRGVNDDVSAVVVHPGTKIINDKAFVNFYNLQSITIPNGVSGIGTSAFAGCKKLDDVAIPDSVTRIGSWAFSGCTGLKSVTIGKGIECIESEAFKDCSALSDVYISNLHAWCKVEFHSSYSNVCTANPLSLAQRLYINGVLTEDLVIPEGVTEIGKYAFLSCEMLRSATLPDSVTTIGDYAFSYCGLKHFNIPKDVTKLGMSILAGNSQLETLTIPYIYHEYSYPRYGGEYTNLGFLFGDSGAGDLFWSVNQSYYYWQSGLGGGTKWVEFKIPKSLKTVTITESVGNNTFENCVGIETLIVADGVGGINGQTFANCSNLTEVILPDNPPVISKTAFKGCDMLKYSVYDNGKYLGNAENPYLVLVDGVSNTITTCEIHPQTKKIAAGAFGDCENLTTITVCNDVSAGSSEDFQSVKKVIVEDGVQKLTAQMIFNQSAVEEIVIPSSVTNVENNALYNSKNLQVIYYRGSQTQWKAISMYYMDRSIDATILYDMRFVVFKNWNGALLGEKMFQQGETITFDLVPGKTADNTFTYTFSGWDQTVCTGDMEVTAQYTATCIDYTVEFQNWDGSVLQTKTYHWSDPVSAPADPVRPYDDTYYYVFTGWDASVSATCDGNKTYTAVYEAKARTAATTPTTPVVLDYTPTKVTLEPTEDYEYSLDGITWQDSNTFVGLKADTQYTFYQRVKETETTFASQTSPVLNFKTAPKAACSVKPVAPIVADYTYNKIVLVSQEGYEYRLNNGAWTTNPTFTGLSADTTYTVYQRITETAEEFASDASRGVTVKTAAIPTGKTSASRYEQLRQYISDHATSSNGKVLLITQAQSSANYTYRLTNQNEGITFSMVSEHKGSSGFDITTHFTLYPNSKYITVSCTVSYFSGGKVMDMAMDTFSVNRSTYTVNTKLYSSESGFLYITSSDFSNLATTSMGVLCTYWNAHILSNLGFDLEDLGFVSFVNNSPSACDIPSGYHAGTLVLRNQREAGCLIDGYTGDHYCSACGEKVKIGNAIACVGMHSYDNNCDNACNACGEERIVTHTYTSGCDEKCDICNHARIAPADHTFDTDGVCTVCGAPDRIPGDIDGNDAVTQDDAVYLLLHTMFGKAFYPLNGAEGDIDCNGSVDQEDAVYLLLHTMFGESFYPLNTPALPAKTKE